MDFISKLPKAKLKLAEELASIGFDVEPIVRESISGRKFLVSHNRKTQCAVYCDLDTNDLYVGGDAKPFKPDLKYSLTISGATSPELLDTIKRAASEYTIRNVKDFYDSDSILEGSSESLFDKAGLNRSNTNYLKAYESMEKIGIDNIAAFVEKYHRDSKACASAAASIPAMSSISPSRWNHIVLVYNKIAPYLAISSNVGEKIAQVNSNNGTDTIQAFNNETIETEPFDEEEAEAQDKAALESARADYKASLDELASYVKSAADVVIHKKMNRLFTTRGCLVTGTSGTSKTFTTTTALHDAGLVEGQDYVIRNVKALADKLYQILYNDNGKIIILDDCPNVFSGQSRVAFWKSAMETTPKRIQAPMAKGENGYFNPKLVRNRYQRFLLEAGYVDTHKDKEAKISTSGSYLKKTTPAIADSFIFEGAVIVISNLSLDDIQSVVKREGSVADWEAIRDRFQIITLAPPPAVLWESIKSKIIDDRDNPGLTDDTRIINSTYADDVISFVEGIMNSGEPYTLQWRYFITLGSLLKPATPDNPMLPNIDTLWRRKLQKSMQPKSF